MGLLPDFLKPIAPYAGAIAGGAATGWVNPAGYMAGYGLGTALSSDPADPYKQVAGSGDKAAQQFRDLAAQFGNTPGNKYATDLRNAPPGSMEEAYQNYLKGQYMQPGVTGGEYNRMAAEGAPDYVRGFGGRQAGGLETPGMYEEFVRQSLAGDNPALARQRHLGEAAINQQAIARGSSGNTGTMGALAEYNAALDANEYMRRAELAKGAQEIGLGRLAQAQGLAGAQTSEVLAGRGQQLDAAQAADRERLARLQGLGGAAQSSQALEQQRQLALLDALQRGDMTQASLLKDAIEAEYGAGASRAQGTQAGQEGTMADLGMMLNLYGYGKENNWWGQPAAPPPPITDKQMTQLEDFLYYGR